MKGVDVPMPKKRVSKAEAKHQDAVNMIVPAGMERVLFKPGSLFDRRFPHILREQHEQLHVLSL